MDIPTPHSKLVLRGEYNYHRWYWYTCQYMYMYMRAQEEKGVAHNTCMHEIMMTSLKCTHVNGKLIPRGKICYYYTEKMLLKLHVHV